MKFLFFNQEDSEQIYLIDDSGIQWGVPRDPANSDYKAYLAWVAEGNTAEEWSPDASE